VEAGNFVGYVQIANAHPQWTGKVDLIDSKLLEPLRWRKPQRIFVNSMSDLFHETLSYSDINRVFAVMSLCDWHTFQILTKRASRMLEYCHTCGCGDHRRSHRRFNCWMG
jgi:protein gp37